MRVFLGLTEIAGFYRGLHRGLREIGVDSVYACAGHPFGYDGGAEEGEAWPVRWFRRMAQRRLAAAKGGRLRRAVLKVCERLSRVPLMVWALWRCEVFIFGFGSCFFTPRELWFFRLLGRRTIHVFHGSDNRPPYLDGARSEDSSPAGQAAVAECTQVLRARVRAIERWGGPVVTLAQTAHFHSRPVLDLLASTGLAVEAPATGAPRAEAGHRLLVLHAPSHPAAKGTPRIRALVERLRAKGLDFAYRELSGCPHEEVLRLLAECDVVVDACYSETPLSGLATEAAHFAKPAVVGGYAGAHVRRVSAGNGLPVEAYCRPEEMEAMLERLLTDDGFRRECGQRAARFVREHWSVRAVAERFLQIARGEIPAHWWFDPAELDYVEGGCLEAGEAAARVRRLVAAEGEMALGMEHNPRLLAALLAAAGVAKTTG